MRAITKEGRCAGEKGVTKHIEEKFQEEDNIDYLNKIGAICTVKKDKIFCTMVKRYHIIFSVSGEDTGKGIVDSFFMQINGDVNDRLISNLELELKRDSQSFIEYEQKQGRN